MTVRPAKTPGQPGHPPCLIRVSAVRMKKAWVLSYPVSAQRRLWSDWADVQADLSLRWAHSHFVGFVISRLNYDSNQTRKTEVIQQWVSFRQSCPSKFNFLKSTSDSSGSTPNNPRATSVRVLMPKPCIDLIQNLWTRSKCMMLLTDSWDQDSQP